MEPQRSREFHPHLLQMSSFSESHRSWYLLQPRFLQACIASTEIRNLACSHHWKQIKICTSPLLNTATFQDGILYFCYFFLLKYWMLKALKCQFPESQLLSFSGWEGSCLVLVLRFVVQTEDRMETINARIKIKMVPWLVGPGWMPGTQQSPSLAPLCNWTGGRK